MRDVLGSFIFCSKSIRRPSTLDIAEQEAASKAQRLFEHFGVELCSTVSHRLSVATAIGVWEGEAEESASFRFAGSPSWPRLRYAAALLAVNYHQRDVLVFREDLSGEQRLWRIRSRLPADELYRVFEQREIFGRTHVRDRDGSIDTYLFDPFSGQSLEAIRLTQKMEELGSMHEVTVSKHTGLGNFLTNGAGTSYRAAIIFEGIIRNFESTHPKESFVA